jgi:hypothetical protein
MLFSDTENEAIRGILRDHERRITALYTARTAEATTVSGDGSDFIVENGASVLVRGGGDMGVADGGRLYATYPSGNRAAQFGHLIWATTGADAGYGLLVQTDGSTEETLLDIFRARLTGGVRSVLVGQTPAPEGAVEYFQTWAQTEQHYAYEQMRLQTIDNADIEILSDNRLWLFADGNLDGEVNGNIALLANGTAALGGDGGTFIQPLSGSGTANVRMDTVTGQITYISSTEHVKSDIQDLVVDPGAVLQLRPRTWLPGPVERQCPDWLHVQHDEGECRAGELVDPPEDVPREVGFVAEELDALGLTQFVEYGVDGAPTSIRYDRLTAALVPLVQQQQELLNKLTERLEALEQRFPEA